LHLPGCGLLLQVGDDGVRVEDGQPLRDCSSRRPCRRASSAEGPRPQYLPFNSEMGSEGSGRITTRSPRSTTITRRVFHRALALAGIETWPLRDTVMTC
jgi:hypothetical protein